MFEHEIQMQLLTLTLSFSILIDHKSNPDGLDRCALNPSAIKSLTSY